MEHKTPLYECHVACGGKMVPFAGYLLPVQYETGVIAEHRAVRTRAGLFDVSHMGEITFTGPDALANLNGLLTNDFTDMLDGQARYSPMCDEKGGVVDDVIVYRMNARHYMVVVNASNREKDVAWMDAHRVGDARIEDISDRMAQIALQGPAAWEILAKIMKAEDIPANYYSFIGNAVVGGIPCMVSQTGYTGEKGYEIYLPSEEAPRLWNLLLETGKERGLIPCGLGARDTLRLEAAMPLYGHEMDDSIDPLETGLGFAVKMSKPDFIGKKALEAKGLPRRKRVGLKMNGRGIARGQETVYAEDKPVGATTSGTFAPFLGYPVAMALLDIVHSAPGTLVWVDVRGRKVDAEVVPLPFYKIERK
jgi:aminomethyltransferase